MKRLRRMTAWLTLAMGLVLAAQPLAQFRFRRVTIDPDAKYVDNASGHNCANSAGGGTEVAPFCTITYGQAHIAGSGTLYVKSGSYAETPDITGTLATTLAGTAGDPTKILAYPGASVTIHGSGNSGNITLGGVTWLVWGGFEVTNLNQGLFVNTDSHDVVIQNVTVHLVGQEGIHVQSRAYNITIQDTEVYDTYKLGGCCNGEGIYVGSSCTASTDQWVHDVTLRRVKVHDVGSEGMEFKPGTYNGVVENSLFYNTNQVDVGVGQSAIEINERDCPGGTPQSWTGNPSHIVRNNIVHDNETGIRLGTGSSAYNNVVYASSIAAIAIDNLNSDSFTRFVYHNTLQSAGISQSGSPTTDIKNNIGTTTSAVLHNRAYNAGFFVNPAGFDFRLLTGQVPIDDGLDLTATVSKDLLGVVRPVGAAPDLGAYEGSF